MQENKGPQETGHWVLVGMPGSGKSSVGRELAVLSNRAFCDVDAMIEAHCRKRISEIFSQMGEVRFRQMEHEMLAKALAESEHSVISTGGGAVLAEENRRLMRESGWVVYLQVSLDELARRTRREGHRPLLQGRDADEVLAELLAAREEFYLQADVVVAVAGKGVRQIAEEIVECAKRKTGCAKS